MEAYLNNQDYTTPSIELLSEQFIAANYESVVTELGTKFIGAIICFENVKFLITSVDAFVHLDDIDDCSQKYIWPKKTVFSKLHHKSNERGDGFFEVSIIVHGCIELLAVGGLVKIKGRPLNTFLGSSIKPMTHCDLFDSDEKTEQVFIKKQTEPIFRTERLLRQYYKKDSMEKRQFHLKTMYDIGFYPINPLKAHEHPSVDSAALDCQSRLLNIFAKRRVENEKLNYIFELMTQPNFLYIYKRN